MESQWIFCPLCGEKTRVKVHRDTLALCMPVYCRKCNAEYRVDIKNMVIRLSSEPVVNLMPSR